MKIDYLGSSYKDPDGRVFRKNGTIYRGIDKSYKDNYSYLISSGLYKRLTSLQLLIPHTETRDKQSTFYKIIKPEPIPFISYPYEWCFSELKDAALVMLTALKISLEYGMTLKDASAFNIQFYKGKPILIDTLSFRKYVEGTPWVAYRQFCMHFLAPLLLMSYKDINLNKLLRMYLDGIPLELVSTLLPKSTYFNPSYLIHIHIHARLEKQFANTSVAQNKRKMDKKSLEALRENLENTVRGITLRQKTSHWSTYYETNSYTKESFTQKKNIVRDFVKETKAKTALDIGANTGEFSTICTDLGLTTVSLDNDGRCMENLYLYNKKRNEAKCLPLCIDITNPTPSIGWENDERLSFTKRGKFDVVLALALIHHLRLTNNVPFEHIAHLASRLGNYLIIEFVPKEDSQSQRLLANRVNTSIQYTRETFEVTFTKMFTIQKMVALQSPNRYVYLMKNKLHL
jgi:2-polyprenyl-3-methyl-5-hydroxy-6-metoxy-1,4-benzoquinol methylase